MSLYSLPDVLLEPFQIHDALGILADNLHEALGILADNLHEALEEKTYKIYFGLYGSPYNLHEPLWESLQIICLRCYGSSWGAKW